MSPPTLQDGMVVMPRDEFEELLARAAERGARRALADVGLDGEDAAHDIRELRGLLEAFNAAKHTAWQTVIRLVTTGFLLALVAGAVIKLKVFGGGQ
ncbi:MAG: hypothetical protein KatS3mg128_0149 [Silanimonas sp.]|jgi:hypothetical protein|uniref:Transmembrane protein n=2 Tax=Pseudomonadota TaxID=1224 RepID=A0AA35UHN3_METCP|nr:MULTISPECIES: DUF6127 family protein [Gammaproteobacteria]OJW51368.1 MAG: hypothetical protein BGO60_12570 [Thiobacillus sp. 65-1059]QXP89151.1 hypothetical protein KW114_08365 [Methylococcus capsulatus]GIX39100.1 MAG: hypothetical protein KatS3mg128_0149 [Silanimonas sp.]CAI8799445.1 conserved protein of unknown function [Methylococcus capsulatus]